MNNEQEEVKQIVAKVIAAHIARYGATANVLRLRTGAYIVSIIENNKSLIDDGFCLDGLPEDVWADYVHCRAHELAGRYIKQKWFLIPNPNHKT
jgi:hypothetical protein